MAGLDSRFDEGVRERVVFAGLLYVELAAGTVKTRCLADVILVPLIVGEDVLVIPAVIIQRAPFVIICRVAAHVDRAVDGGATSEQLAARARDLPPVDLRTAAIGVLPVVAGVRQQEHVADRQRRFNVDREIQIGRTGLDQCHACGWIFRKAVCQQTARSAGTDHDEIKILAVLTSVHRVASLVTLSRADNLADASSAIPVAVSNALLSMVLPLQLGNVHHMVAARSQAEARETPAEAALCAAAGGGLDAATDGISLVGQADRRQLQPRLQVLLLSEQGPALRGRYLADDRRCARGLRPAVACGAARFGGQCCVARRRAYLDGPGVFQARR